MPAPTESTPRGGEPGADAKKRFDMGGLRVATKQNSNLTKGRSCMSGFPRDCSGLGPPESRSMVEESGRMAPRTPSRDPTDYEEDVVLKEMAVYVKDTHWLTEKSMLLAEGNSKLLSDLRRDRASASLMPGLDSLTEHLDRTIQDSVFKAMISMESRLAEAHLSGASGRSQNHVTVEQEQLVKIGDPMRIALEEIALTHQKALEGLSDRIYSQQVSVDKLANDHSQSLTAMLKNIDEFNVLARSIRDQPTQQVVISAHHDQNGSRLMNPGLDKHHEVVAGVETNNNGAVPSKLGNPQGLAPGDVQRYKEYEDWDKRKREEPAPRRGTTSRSRRSMDSSAGFEEYPSERSRPSMTSDQVLEEKEEKKFAKHGSHATRTSGQIAAEFGLEEYDDGVDRRPWPEKFVSSSKFEFVFAILIVLNTVSMCAESEYRGQAVGHHMGVEGAQSTTELGDVVFQVIGLTFAIVFTGEVLVKIIGLRLKFWKSSWNLFDFCIIAISWLDFIVGADLPVNPMVLRLVRLVRLVRLLRGLESLEVFDNLSLMVRGIKGGGPVIVWVMVLVFPILAANALALNYILVDFINDETQSENVRLECYKLFGTFAKAMLSMFEVTFANWAPICRFLSTHVDSKYIMFFMLYKLVIGIGFLRITYGVFLHVTFACATSDEHTVIAQQKREKAKYGHRMQQIFHQFDSSGEGVLSKEEFKEMVSDPDVKISLSALNLEVDDPDMLFAMTDEENNGQVGNEDVVCSFARFMGEARSVDLLALTCLTKQALDKLDKVLSMERVVEADVNKQPTLVATKVLESTDASVQQPRVVATRVSRNLYQV